MTNETKDRKESKKQTTNPYDEARAMRQALEDMRDLRDGVVADCNSMKAEFKKMEASQGLKRRFLRACHAGDDVLFLHSYADIVEGETLKAKAAHIRSAYYIEKEDLKELLSDYYELRAVLHPMKMAILALERETRRLEEAAGIVEGP